MTLPCFKTSIGNSWRCFVDSFLGYILPSWPIVRIQCYWHHIVSPKFLYFFAISLAYNQIIPNMESNQEKSFPPPRRTTRLLEAIEILSSSQLIHLRVFGMLCVWQLFRGWTEADQGSGAGCGSVHCPTFPELTLPHAYSPHSLVLSQSVIPLFSYICVCDIVQYWNCLI